MCGCVRVQMCVRIRVCLGVYVCVGRVVCVRVCVKSSGTARLRV